MRIWSSRLAGAAIAAAQGAAAQGADSPPLHEVVITATRVEADPFNVPAAISTVSAEQMRNDALGVNLADDVATVPGLLARNRNNYAQDQQVSIRGIGANSAFGIRGVRVYQDGIPATGPDGQGQVSQFNLDSASRVEILRGPFSALYGNSSGGVIQLVSATGKGPLQVRSGVAYGSFDTFRASLNALDSAGPLGYNLDFAHFKVDGFREHSSARNESFNGKLNYSLNDSNRLALIANVISRPDAQDPLGITPAQFAADPEATDSAAIRFNTRKSLKQQQGGLIYDLDLTDSQSVRVLGYYGHRSVQQFLSIPQSAQGASGSAGGVVDLNRRYGGADTRWSWKGELAERLMTWVAGLSYDRQNELRRGYNNFIGSQLGVQGTLRRDENNIVRDLDEYTQGTWDFASLWSAMVGVRHSDVKFDSEDHYIVVAYRADGGSGLNLGLRPARSNNTELGAKVAIDPDISAEFAVFQAQTRDEIVAATNIGGRSTYQNAGRTRRRGAEYSLNYRIAPDWRLQLAYTYVDAYYSDAYTTCTVAPCPVANTPIPAGNRLPGVPKHNAYAALRWGAEVGWHASVSGQYVTAVAVDDLNDVFAPAYALMGLDGGYAVELSRFKMSAFLRINNLLNRRYVGSIIVNDGNGRYFEPGAGFNLLGGVSVTMK